MENWDFKSDSVQAYWNELENQLVNIIDELAPLVEFINDQIIVPVPAFIKNKIYVRKRLLRSNRRYHTQDKLIKIKALNQEIKQYYDNKKRASVRRNKQ